MIITWHFTFFLINLLLWGAAGFFITKILLKKKLNIKKAAKVFSIGIFGGLFGGLLGFLANGMPDIGFSVTNFATALLFSVIPTLMVIPQAKGRIS